MTTSQPSIVMVPVPVDHLPHVYGLLGRLAGSPEEPAVSGPPTEEGSARAWSVAEISRLRQALAPNSVVRAILDLGSAQPEQPVWFGDACDRVGLTHPQGTSGLAGFSKLLRSRFGRDGNKADWPFRPEWTNGRALYTVDTMVAQAWLGHDDQHEETPA